MKKISWFIRRIMFLAMGLLILIGLGFYYIPFPHSWQASLAASQSDYFFQDEEKWLKEHSLLEAGAVKLIEFKLRHDVIMHLQGRLQLETKSHEESISIAAHEVRNTYITQLQEEIPVISNSSTISMVRGFGFCDQINAGLALLLHDKFEQVQLYGIINPPDHARHTLIKSYSSLGTVWIDAFTCVNAFGFPEELSTEGKKLIPSYEDQANLLFEKEAYRQGTFFNEFSLSYSSKKAFGRIKNILAQKSYNPKQVMVMEKPDSLLAINPSNQKRIMDTLEKESALAKEAYIKARVFQLYGENEKAMHFYEEAKNRSVNGWISKYAAVFIKRLNGEEELCRM